MCFGYTGAYRLQYALFSLFFLFFLLFSRLFMDFTVWSYVYKDKYLFHATCRILRYSTSKCVPHLMFKQQVFMMSCVLFLTLNFNLLHKVNKYVQNGIEVDHREISTNKYLFDHPMMTMNNIESVQVQRNTLNFSTLFVTINSNIKDLEEILDKNLYWSFIFGWSIIYFSVRF